MGMKFVLFFHINCILPNLIPYTMTLFPKLYFSLLLVFVIGVSPTLAQEWQWAKQAGGTAYDQVQGMKVDGSGNLYVIGNYESSAEFEEEELVSLGYRDIFMAKYDSLGALLWVKSYGGPGMDVGIDIQLDKEGNILLAGIFANWALFEEDTLRATDGSDIFLAKFTPDGEKIWVKREGGLGYDGAYGIACGQDSSVYLLGRFTHLPDQEESGALEREKGNHLFLAKYTNSGELLWVKPTMGKGDIFGTGITTDNSGHIFLTGSYSGRVQFAEDSLANGSGLFIAKFLENGDLIRFGRIFEKGIRAFGADIILGSDDNLYLAGGYTSKEINKDTLDKKKENTDIFVAQVDPNSFAVNWSYRAGGQGVDKAMSLCADEENLYFTGWFSEQCPFTDSLTLEAYRGNDLFWAKINYKGELLNVDSPLQKGMGYSKAILLDDFGHLYWGGWFSGVQNFPTDLFFAKGKADAFVAKLRIRN